MVIPLLSFTLIFNSTRATMRVSANLVDKVCAPALIFTLFMLPVISKLVPLPKSSQLVRLYTILFRYDSLCMAYPLNKSALPVLAMA